jgi:MFS family permease
MPPRRLIVLVCLTMGVNTVSIGAFPALLPEIGTAVRLADWQLGAVAGAFGFARMLADVPVGLFITHHLARALTVAPLFLASGALIMTLGGDFATVLLGRVLMGAGHTLSMLAGITTVLRYRAGPGLASSLNAMEFSSMLGVLGGVALVAFLPRSVSWGTAFLLASAPVLVAIAVLPLLRRALPSSVEGSRPLFARGEAPAAAPSTSSTRLALLAGVAGTAIAISYSAVDQFVIPLRGSREFGLERAGIARLLMLSQLVDIVALLPVGRLADRHGTARVVGAIMLTFTLALTLIGFGTLPMLAAGCALFGLSMAGWMLPLGILRSVTPPAEVAWRVALYRVSVDGGMFLGPVLAGLLTAQHAGVLPAVLIVVMVALAMTLLRQPRPTAPSP